jgi:integrase
MRCLRRAFNYALERDITANNPFRHYRIPIEETVMRVLPIEKMRQLLTMETRYHYTEYRDMFLLTFYLIGINTVDLSRLTHDNVVDGRIEYRRAKTGKLYSIKIWPETAAILEKYKGKNHLLSVFDRCSNYKAYQGTMNNALTRLGHPARDKDGKVITAKNGQAKMVPLEKDLSIYWARYSWATYAADLDIPKDTISEALGHSHGAKVTGIYIKYSRDKVDAANRKVIDYLLDK